MAVTWAVTINSQFRQIVGSEAVVDATLVATGTYTSGGDTLATSAVGLDTVDFVASNVDGNGANTNGAALVAWNLGSGPGTSGNMKIQLFGGAASGSTQAELSAATTVTGLTLRCRFYGVA